MCTHMKQAQVWVEVKEARSKARVRVCVLAERRHGDV